MKIVQILHHSVSPFLRHQDGADPVHYDTGWPMIFARAMRARDASVELECWRPERVVKQETAWRDDDRILHRVFPSFYLRYGMEVSRPLLRAVKQARRDPGVRFIVHGSYNVHAYLLGPLLARSRAILQSHGGFPAPVMFRLGRHPWRRWAYLPLAPWERRALGRYPHIFALSAEEHEGLSKMLPAGRVSVSPVGMDFDLFSPGMRAAARRDLGIPESARVILYVGRLAPEKGVQHLIEAFANLVRDHADARLAIIGEGALADDLRARANRLGVSERVCLAGVKPQSELPRWYRSADVTVMPSLNEGFGMAAAESLACGTPVVATRMPGVSEIVRVFECGVLVPPGDPAALARAIGEVVERRVRTEPNIRAGLARYGWATKLAHIDATFAGMEPGRTGTGRASDER